MAAGITPGEAGIKMRPVQDVVDEARQAYRKVLMQTQVIDAPDVVDNGSSAQHPFIISCNAMREIRRRYPGDFI